MVSENTKTNKEKILAIIKEAKEYDGYQQSPSTKTKLHQMRAKLISLSDGEVDFYFERNNSNSRLGAYKITLKCTDETEAFLNEEGQQEEEEGPKS